MTFQIHTIYHSRVNCYLLESAGNYILIDSGYARDRKQIEKEMIDAGCRADNLKLVFITHGDPDHAGNAAHFRRYFGAKIAMHAGDLEMVEKGNVLANRKFSFITRFLARLFSFVPAFSLKKQDRFSPDICVEDGQNLYEYGLQVKVIHIPGHSSGSVGLLTSEGDLFCGDFLACGHKPKYSSAYVDIPAASSSVEKLDKLSIRTVYPGHGRPFSWEEFVQVRNEGKK